MSDSVDLAALRAEWSRDGAVVVDEGERDDAARAIDGLLALAERLRARVAELQAARPIRDGSRLLDLVRYKRGELHDDGLISNEECAELVNVGAQSARRLEEYDSIKREVAALRERRDRLLAQLLKKSEAAVCGGSDHETEEVVFVDDIKRIFAAEETAESAPRGGERASLAAWLDLMASDAEVFDGEVRVLSEVGIKRLRRAAAIVRESEAADPRARRSLTRYAITSLIRWRAPTTCTSSSPASMRTRRAAT